MPQIDALRIGKLPPQDLNLINAAIKIKDIVQGERHFGFGNDAYNAKMIMESAERGHLQPSGVRRFLRREINQDERSLRVVEAALESNLPIPWGLTGLKEKPSDPEFSPVVYAHRCKVEANRIRYALSVFNATRALGVAYITAVPEEERSWAYGVFLEKARQAGAADPVKTSGKAFGHIQKLFRIG